jgi:restriction endonuclease Mrr
MALVRQGHSPFTSAQAKCTIDDCEPIHPENADANELVCAAETLDVHVAELVADPDMLFQLSPREFEKLIATVYSAHGFEVTLTAGPHDHGIDAVATLRVPTRLPPAMAQHVTIGIQAKRYRQRKRVRESEVLNLLGSLKAGNHDRGILITTSSLTGAATRFIESRRVVADKILVVAGDRLLELLISYCRIRGQLFWDTGYASGPSP